MQWLKSIKSAFVGNKFNLEEVKRKIKSNKFTKNDQSVTDSELREYVEDIRARMNKMVKDLRSIYSKFGIEFSGFKSLDEACSGLRNSLKSGREEDYNNLVKLESAIMTEQRRHVVLIKMAVTKDGKNVIDQITQDANANAIFREIFGTRDMKSQVKADGLYQRLWSEIHELSEYILVKKNKVYH